MKMHLTRSYKIKTQRFELRIPNSDDFQYVFSASRHKGFNDGMLWDPPGRIEELQGPLERNLRAWDDGSGYSFTIIDKQKKEFLGRISIRKTNQNDVWNVGFWTHPKNQGQGIMTEVLAAVIDFGFTQLAATSIEADHAIWNKASEKVLKNNGMKFIAYIEKGFEKNGEWVDENKLAINYKDWEASFEENGR